MNKEQVLKIVSDELHLGKYEYITVSTAYQVENITMHKSDFLSQLSLALDKEEAMECESCNKKSPDVSYRPNAYAQDVGNDPTAYHTVCDECDYQNRMDI